MIYLGSQHVSLAAKGVFKVLFSLKDGILNEERSQDVRISC